MKKQWLILSLVLVASLLLGACSDNGEVPTQDLGELPGTAEATLENQFPATGGTTTAQSTEPASGTETTGEPGTTPTSERPQMTSTQVLVGSGLRNDYRLISYLLIFDVYDSAGDRIGEVQDMVLNVCTARVDYLVVKPDEGLDFTLGSLLLVPYQAVNTGMSSSGAVESPGLASTQTMTGTQQVTGTVEASPVVTATAELLPGQASSPIAGIDQRRLILRDDVSLATIQNAPVTLGEINIVKQGWDADAAAYWQDVLGGPVTSECGVTAAPGATETTTGTPEATAAATETPQAIETPSAAATQGPAGAGNPSGSSVVFANEATGSDIYDGNDNHLGIISDVIMNQNLDRINYIVVNADPSLNLNDRSVLIIPVGAFNVEYPTNDFRQPKFVLLVDQDVLMNSPRFGSGEINLNNASWDADVATYWQSYITPSQNGNP